MEAPPLTLMIRDQPRLPHTPRMCEFLFPSMYEFSLNSRLCGFSLLVCMSSTPYMCKSPGVAAPLVGIPKITKVLIL